MEPININKQQKTTWFIAFFTFCLLFLVSPDSYTHDLFNRADSSIFFMCGKAWMNGMIPYVDFTDSKGPLLWIIYGIGYLISHYDYIGVFWLSILLYWGIFYYTYKLANISLSDKYLSTICVLFISLYIFCPWYHYEIRAEDWCLFFVILAIYRVSLHLYSNQTVSLNKTSYVLGICIAGTLLIKYSISVMMGTIIAYTLYYLIREKKNVIAPILCFILGIATIILPFLIYFLTKGDLYAFVSEYFLNTFKTIHNSNSFGTYIHELFCVFANSSEAILFTTSIVGCYLFSRTIEKYKFFPLFIVLGFWMITIHHASDYYFSICTFFPVWLIIILLQKVKYYFQNNPKRKIIYISLTVIAFCTLWNYTFTQGYLLRNLFFYNNNNRSDYYNVAQLMSQIEKPTVIYMHFTVSHGEGMPVAVLPGSKYFFSQLGATKDMDQEQREDVKKGKADFIIIDTEQLTNSEKELLNDGNYHKCYEYPFWFHQYCVFTKHNLRTPDNNIKMSNLDVLLKRNYLK